MDKSEIRDNSAPVLKAETKTPMGGMGMALPPVVVKKGPGPSLHLLPVLMPSAAAPMGKKPNPKPVPVLKSAELERLATSAKPLPKPSPSVKAVHATASQGLKKSAAKARAVNAARALYSYTAQRDDELSFSEGDLVAVLAKNEDGWWEGEANGARGVFPGNYVEETSRQRVRAQWAYTAQRSDELSFSEGDIITVLEEKGNWHRGECNGRAGLFPANYVVPV